jgi:hypothetical protein
VEITKENLDAMRRHPAVIGVLSVLFFPVGLWLVWTHPTWSKKSKWLWTGAIGFLLLVFAASNDDDSSSNAASVPSSQASGSGNGSKSAKAYVVGEPFVLGKNKYTIHGIRFMPQIGKVLFGKFMGKQAAPGATLAVVSYEIENVSNETQTVLTDDFTLVDSEGRTYRPSTDANVALLQESDDKDFILSQLQPGVPRRMSQAFELPAKSTESSLSLVIPEKGLWGSGKATVVLPSR